MYLSGTNGKMSGLQAIAASRLIFFDITIEKILIAIISNPSAFLIILE